MVTKYAWGGYTVILNSRKKKHPSQVCLGTQPLSLGFRGSQILALLIEKGRISYAEASRLWTPAGNPTNALLNVIRRLRKSFGDTERPYKLFDHTGGEIVLVEEARKLTDPADAKGGQPVASGPSWISTVTPALGLEKEVDGANAGDQPIFIADTITVQLAGELIHDLAFNLDERHRFRHLYMRCLEDVAFMILFAPRFGVAGDIPPMKGERPGETFLYELSICTGDVVPQSLLRAPPTEDAIRERRTSLEKHLGVVNRAFAVDRQYWYEYVERDARSFLGQDSSVMRKSFRGVENLRFDPRRKWIHNRELQKHLADDCLDALTARLRTVFPKHEPKAVREFIACLLLEHFARSEAFDLAAEDSRNFRLPFVTRTEVRRQVIQAHGHSREARNAGRVIKPPQEEPTIRDLTKDALSRAMKSMRGERRQRILPILVDLRDNPHFREYKTLVHDYTKAFKCGNSQAAGEAIGALQRLFGYAESNIMIDPGDGSGAFLRSLRRAGERYPSNLYKVFPELKPGP